MALFQAVTIAMRYTITAELATSYRQCMKEWVRDLETLHPDVYSQKRTRTNIHIAQHLYDFLLLYGPVTSWWEFPFESLIGILEKMTTNEHVGG